MKALVQIGLIIVLMCFATFASAWSYKGHIVVAQVAYDNLTLTARKQVDNLANHIFNRLPNKLKQRLDKNYPNVSVFAKIAVLPDAWRFWHLKTIFKKNNALIPTVLKPYQDQRTANWHFIDQPYPCKECSTMKTQNVVWAINTMEPTFTNGQDMDSQAVMLVFLEHFVGDAHQPLHTITHVDKQCRDDRGGNLFCLSQSTGRRCSKSLHSLWDSGVGYVQRKSNLRKKAERLQREFPETSLAPFVGDFNPNDWVKQEYQFTPFIYSLEENQRPNSLYYRQGQAIARKQMVLAGYRLAKIIDKYLCNNN